MEGHPEMGHGAIDAPDADIAYLPGRVGGRGSRKKPCRRADQTQTWRKTGKSAQGQLCGNNAKRYNIRSHTKAREDQKKHAQPFENEIRIRPPFTSNVWISDP